MAVCEGSTLPSLNPLFGLIIIISMSGKSLQFENFGFAIGHLE